MYGEDYLYHGWLTSKDQAKRAQQKKAQDEYNRRYYQSHKKEIMAQRHSVQEAQKGQAYINSQHASSPGKGRNVQRHSVYEADKAQTKLDQRSDLFPESRAMLKRETALYMNSHPGVSQKDAENAAKQIILERWYGDRFDEMNTDTRNQRFNQTLRNQGKNVKASELQKQKNAEASKISKAQTDAARKRSRVAKNKYAHIQESNAQEKAARNRTIRKALERSKAESARRSASETSAYASARKKQKEYNNSFEGKLTRAFSRTKKRFDKGKKSVQKLLKNLQILSR